VTRLDRAAAWFITPGAPPPRPAAAPFPPAARIVVLGIPPDVAASAAAVALSLRAHTGLVAYWPPDRPLDRGVATRSAARLAAQLVARDLPAVARGRLAWLALPGEPEAAAAAVRKASTLVDGPLVTGLAGARPPELEALVAEHDLAVVAADPDTPLARAALAGLAARGIDAVACPPPRRGLPRRLALAGLAAPRLAPPLGGAATHDSSPRGPSARGSSARDPAPRGSSARDPAARDTSARDSSPAATEDA
jgi:hypothetical protein